jgi:pimeloyl-ACP methyl ester carboxylesterase
MKHYSILFQFIVLMALSGCTYLYEAGKQAQYAAQLNNEPKLRTYKHMVTTGKFFVYGKILGDAAINTASMAVVAMSDRFQRNEIVDINNFSRIDSYYGLNLPEGTYRLLAVKDLDGNGFFEESEVIGCRMLSLSEKETPGKVKGGFDMVAGSPGVCSGAPIHIEAPATNGLAESLFYPKGTIRSLDDPIFSPQMTTLGMYDPAAFLEVAPMMFYALEECVGYKIPVIFVHGIDGSPREFTEIIKRLDRRLYQPWFFYYPSGNDLSQLSEFFYNIFLSGKVIPHYGTPTIIVAHSMGGLIVRDAMNRHKGEKEEALVQKVITIASPMGGHPGARFAKNAPLVLPSWRDLNPESDFIRQLYRTPLPGAIGYHLFYAYGNASTLKLGDNSDGVVPLWSQLAPPAQNEAARQYGFNNTHTGILANPEAISRLLGIVCEVKPPFSQHLLAEVVKGGYTVELGENYTPLEKYFVRHYAHFFNALASGKAAPEDPVQAHFVRACRGEVPPTSPAETAWIKFTAEHREPL